MIPKKKQIYIACMTVCMIIAIFINFKKQKNQSIAAEQSKPDKLIETVTTTSPTGKSRMDEAKRLNKKGGNFKKQGNFNDAIYYFTKAIEIDSKYGVALVNRANTYIILGEYNKAIQDSSRAIELFPEFSYAYIARGWAYHYLEEDSLSLSDAQEAIEIAPDLVDSYFILGANYEAIDNYLKAVEVYSIAIEINPKAAVSYYKIAKTYSYLDNYEQAKENCHKAVELKANNRNINSFCYKFININL